MDWTKFKLGVGPMSKQVVDACLRYSENYNYPIMIIASRNQVDYDSGYAFTTSELGSFVRSHGSYDSNRVKICRDHCGPNFSDNDKNLNFLETVERCKATIEHDINNGFDLLHIDVSRANENTQAELATILIEHALSKNPNISLEFGSEDNTGQNLHDTLLRIDQQIELASNYKNNIKFLVSQTGSLTKHTQVGVFDEKLSTYIANKIHAAGFLFKEHNADYLTVSHVEKRRKVGVDAINIAPQLGYVHSCVIDKLGYRYEQLLLEFKKYVISQGMWKKWVVDGMNDDEIKFLVSAHYYFNSDLGLLINNAIDNYSSPLNDIIYDEVSMVLDQYRLGYEDRRTI